MSSANKQPIIEVRNIGKRYNITHQQGGYIALRDIFANVLRNPFKFAKHKAKQIVGLAKNEEFWALKNLNFEVQKGEVIGIIGKNGSGKSTLLKILSGITPPTEGEITMRGKVASLLEVGTGFHPELTGRENIFLNGAILGMTKKEIVKKFDAIVAFSGVEKFLDTPVKHYSSGMYVRLAFSVAAHMEPDILIVDEVLAVGDAEFQKKCMGKMEEVTEKEGRTILFVSHNLDAIQQLCKRTILLENGKIKMAGDTDNVISYYLENEAGKESLSNHWELADSPGEDKIRIKSSSIEFSGGAITVGTPFDIVTEFWCLTDDFPINVSMHLYDISGYCIFICSTESKSLSKGLYKATFHIPANLMNDGTYYVSNMFVSGTSAYFFHEHANFFQVKDNRTSELQYGKWSGAVRPTFIKNNYELLGLL